MKIEVLTEKEKEFLSRVKTSKRQARQIRKRNIALLNALNSNKDDYFGEVGCPHCLMEDYLEECKCCAWTLAENNKQVKTEACLRHSFGGVKYNEISRYLSYFAESEDLIVSDGISDKTKEKIRIFLLGHIEWARIILNEKK